METLLEGGELKGAVALPNATAAGIRFPNGMKWAISVHLTKSQNCNQRLVAASYTSPPALLPMAITVTISTSLLTL